MVNSLERIYREHAQALFAFLLNLTRDEAGTGDILQEVFHRLAREPHLLADVRNERAFLFRLVYRQMVDLHRGRTRRDVAERSQEWPLFTTDEDPDTRLYRQALAAALAELPGEQRAVVHLKIWGNLTFAEIADALELPLNTAASRYRYGIEKMRTILRPYYETLS